MVWNVHSNGHKILQVRLEIKCSSTLQSVFCIVPHMFYIFSKHLMETINTLLFALQYTYIFSIYISSVYLYTRYILYVCINIYISTSEFHSGSRYDIWGFHLLLSPLLSFNYSCKVHSPQHIAHPSTVKQ